MMHHLIGISQYIVSILLYVYKMDLLESGDSCQHYRGVTLKESTVTEKQNEWNSVGTSEQACLRKVSSLQWCPL